MAYLHDVKTENLSSATQLTGEIGETKIKTLMVKQPSGNDYHKFAPVSGDLKLLKQSGNTYVFDKPADAKEVILNCPINGSLLEELMEDYRRTGNFNKYNTVVE